ncbi:unnamed protein product [Sphagnum balticum]
MDFRSRLRLLLTIPFYVPVTGGDSGGFMSTVAESTATAPWEESVAKSGDIYFPCKEEQNTASNLSKSISLTSNSRKFWTALLEMSGEELLGLLTEGVPDSAAAATALPLKRAEEFDMAAFFVKLSSIDHPHEPGHTDACLV